MAVIPPVRGTRHPRDVSLPAAHARSGKDEKKKHATFAPVEVRRKKKKLFFFQRPFSQSTWGCAKCQAGLSGQWFPVKHSVNLNHHQLFSLFYRHDKWSARERSPPLSVWKKKQKLRTYDARLGHTEAWVTRLFGWVALNKSSFGCANGQIWEIMSIIYVGLRESLLHYFHISGAAPCRLTTIRFCLSAKTSKVFEVKNTSGRQLHLIQVNVLACIYFCYMTSGNIGCYKK